MAGNDLAGIGGKPDLLGFGNQIAYGEHQAVLADHHAIAYALGAEYPAGERILGYFGAQQHHRIQRLPEIEVQFFGARLQRFVKSPWFRIRHGSDSATLRDFEPGSPQTPGGSRFPRSSP